MTTNDAPVALSGPPTLSFLTGSALDARADTLVLAASSATGEQTGPRLLAEGLSSIDVPALESLLETLGFAGALDEVLRLPAAAVPCAPGTAGLGAAVLLVVGTGQDLARAEDAGRDCKALGGTC